MEEPRPQNRLVLAGTWLFVAGLCVSADALAVSGDSAWTSEVTLEAGSGRDFGGDGRSDILWRHTAGRCTCGR